MKRALVSLLIVFASNSFAEDAQGILQKVKQKYDSIKDAELKFLQRTTSVLSPSKQSISGTLFIKKENKFRVELEGQTIVTDGDTIWSYNPANRQVIIDRFKKNARVLTPERVLAASPTDYSASLLGTEQIGKLRTNVLQLMPRDENSLVTTMKLWVDDKWLIRKVVIIDVNGRALSYFVNEIKLNLNIPDSRFTYQIPRGAETVDLR